MNQRIVRGEVQEQLDSLDAPSQALCREGVASPCSSPATRRVYSESNIKRAFLFHEELAESMPHHHAQIHDSTAWHPLSPGPVAAPASPPVGVPLLYQSACYLPHSYILWNPLLPAAPASPVPQESPYHAMTMSSTTTMFTMAGSPREGAGRREMSPRCWSPAPMYQQEPDRVHQGNSCSCVRMSQPHPVVCCPCSLLPSQWPVPRPELPAPHSPLCCHPPDSISECTSTLTYSLSPPHMSLHPGKYSSSHHIPQRSKSLESDTLHPVEERSRRYSTVLHNNNKPGSPLLFYQSPQQVRRAESHCGCVGESSPLRASPTPSHTHTRPHSSETFFPIHHDPADSHSSSGIRNASGRSSCGSLHSTDSPIRRRHELPVGEASPRNHTAPVPIIQLHSSSSTFSDSLSNTSSLPSSVCLCSVCQEQGSPPSPQKSPRKNWSLRKFLLDRMLASSPYSSTGSRGSLTDM